MPREPNTSDARGMWDVTRPNQQRNAAYGERWPDPFVPVPPRVNCAYADSTNWTVQSPYNGTGNGDMQNAPWTTNGSGGLWNGWGMSSGNCDMKGFLVGTNGSKTDYVLNWITAGNPYGGPNTEYNTAQVRITMGTSNNSNGNRVYEAFIPIAFAGSNGNATYRKLELPPNGNTHSGMGSTTLTIGSWYLVSLSWDHNWNDNPSAPYSTYICGNSQTSETHTISGDSVYMSFASWGGSNPTNWNSKYSNGSSVGCGVIPLMGIGY